MLPVASYSRRSVLGFLAMRSITPSVQDEDLDKLPCSRAMWVLSLHALLADEADKGKW